MSDSNVEAAAQLELLNAVLQERRGWQYLGHHRGTSIWRFRYPHDDETAERLEHVLVKAKASAKGFELKLTPTGERTHYPSSVMTEAEDFFNVLESIERWIYGVFPDTFPCDAFKDPQQRQERCEAPSEFVVTRVLDTDLPLCRHHLGPVLAEGGNVAWPPEIVWSGKGPFPVNGVLPVAQRIREAEFNKVLGL
ncbi:hypothetical protein ACFRJ9_21655 [Paenarthrobacter sp. NPDC056912]|uniref:hypothetical protein n=1 Tax=Paenarthrobacter sp. NPDC056912 TaxID=3345965 RepID=UPI00366DC2A3